MDASQGSDASVMLDDSNGMANQSIERQAIPNKTLKGFNYIDKIKELLESECPGVVSCVDILVLATHDAIALCGGPYYPILIGRRDKIHSYFSEALAEIPRLDSNISQTFICLLNVDLMRGRLLLFWVFLHFLIFLKFSDWCYLFVLSFLLVHFLPSSLLFFLPRERGQLGRIGCEDA
ncbi:hypothetical protein Pfo_022980 [Paulownia fortunei]|nr:hypothetical protein Pfo_022980 [Paulownia fortunei]